MEEVSEAMGWVGGQEEKGSEGEGPAPASGEQQPATQEGP